MTLNNITKAILCERNVSVTLKLMSDEVARLRLTGKICEDIEAVRNDYHLMCDFMYRGFRDEKLDDVYEALLRRLYLISVDMRLAQLVRDNQSFGRAMTVAAQLELQAETVKTELECYVQDMAMSAFEAEDKRSAMIDALNVRHFEYMKRLFSAILVSGMWTDSQTENFVAMLTSPTIDGGDAQIVVSALMLAVMQTFDPHKWLVLQRVYQQTSDESLRQRALVGWVFALPHKASLQLFGDIEMALKNLLASPQVRKELLELQMQMLFCCNADADNEEIKRNIMPTIMKNNNLQMTRLGIEEKEENTMRDVLNPGDSERDMEQMEKSFKRMMDMQRAGSDIYFGGFSQMKRFPFFYELSNWFWPFSLNHPALSGIKQKLNDNKFLTMLLDKGPFCDSDKYSFAFAVSSVIDRLPANVREMLGSEAALGPVESDEARLSPSSVRRSYVQSLYRFFRLYDRHVDFGNPFSIDVGSAMDGLFFAKGVMISDMMADEVVSLGNFLLKRKFIPQLNKLLDNYKDTSDARIRVLRGMAQMRGGKYLEASAEFANLPESLRTEDVIRAEAYCRLAAKQFDLAANLYGQLVLKNPTSLYYNLNLAVCQMNIGRVEEAVQQLFRLEYENSDNDNVKRALAWGLILKGNFAQAQGIYARLIDAGHAVPADFLNAGYAKWLAKDVAGGIEMLRSYCSRVRGNGKDLSRVLADDFANDAALLDAYAVRKSERKIIIDVVVSRL